MCIQHARDIHARALSQVVTRIADAERQFPPSVIPIVAANVAMASMLDELISEPVGQRLRQMLAVREVCAGPSPDRWMRQIDDLVAWAEGLDADTTECEGVE